MKRLSVIASVVMIGCFLRGACAKAEEAAGNVPSKENPTVETPNIKQPETSQEVPVKPESPVEEKKKGEESATPPAQEIETQESKTQAPEKKVEEGLKNSPAAEKKLESSELAGCVVPLKELVNLYEKESASVKKIIERWDARIHSYLERANRLKSEIASSEKELSDAQDSEGKTRKKEVSRLKGQLERLRKEQKILNKDMQRDCRELSKELGDFSKASQTAIKEKFQQVQREVEQTGNE